MKIVKEVDILTELEKMKNDFRWARKTEFSDSRRSYFQKAYNRLTLLIDDLKHNTNSTKEETQGERNE